MTQDSSIDIIPNQSEGDSLSISANWYNVVFDENPLLFEYDAPKFNIDMIKINNRNINNKLKY